MPQALHSTTFLVSGRRHCGLSVAPQCAQGPPGTPDLGLIPLFHNKTAFTKRQLVRDVHTCLLLSKQPTFSSGSWHGVSQRLLGQSCWRLKVQSPGVALVQQLPQVLLVLLTDLIYVSEPARSQTNDTTGGILISYRWLIFPSQVRRSFAARLPIGPSQVKRTLSDLFSLRCIPAICIPQPVKPVLQ